MAFWGKKDDEEKKNQGAFSFATGQQSKTAQAKPTGAAPLSPVTQKDSVSSSLTPLASKPVSSVFPTGSNLDEPKVRSALGPGTVIHGKLSFDAPVSIDGKLSGEIFSSKTLHVGKSGVIDATIEVTALVIRGIVKGSIKVSERVEIRDGGQLLGDVTTPILTMEDGCIFNGSCTMPQATQKKVSDVRKEASAG